jgi:uncharacterized OsmC-like protein
LVSRASGPTVIEFDLRIVARDHAVARPAHIVAGLSDPRSRRELSSAARRNDVSQDKVETIRSSSSGVLGRARNTARGVTVPFDSSSRPQADALTNSEAFLAAVSSCGVTLIEMHAKETGVPLTGMDVIIEGTRTAAEPNRFARVTMTFELAGVSQPQAESLVETYRQR